MTSICCVERAAGGEDTVNRWIHVKPAMFVCLVCAQRDESTSSHLLITHSENLLLSILRTSEGWLLMMLLTSDFSLCSTQKVRLCPWSLTSSTLRTVNPSVLAHTAHCSLEFYADISTKYVQTYHINVSTTRVVSCSHVMFMSRVWGGGVKRMTSLDI